MSESTELTEDAAPALYVWLGSDPISNEPDAQIEDLPGVSDLVLLATAIASGRLGRFLPTRIATSPHQTPDPSGFRSVDVARLLREYHIPHQRCYELLLEEQAAPDMEPPNSTLA